jgi:hypothetical protein
MGGIVNEKTALILLILLSNIVLRVFFTELYYLLDQELGS